jgi:Uma2 family endonuclease
MMQTPPRPSIIRATQEEVDSLVREVLPAQGQWSEDTYLWLTEHTSQLIEFTDGYLEVLAMPTDKHQTIVLFLYEVLAAFVRPRGGKVLVAPLRLKIRAGKYREPDLLLLRSARDPRRQERFWLGADCVMEVVSPEKPERDVVEKRQDYAEAGISEYWLVDPQRDTITVLRFEGGVYVEHGVFPRGAVATSVVLEGFTVSVDALFDAQ